MTPEELLIELRQASVSDLVSVVLYGSSVAGDHIEKASDFNVLVVTERLGIEELRALSPIARKWAKAGNPPPLLFARERLAGSCDVFPIEILDIQDAHRVLYGEDVLSQLEIRYEHFRLQLEHEFKAKLIHLREGYLLAGGRQPAILKLMVDSLSSVLVLCRAALRLFEEEVPPRKLEAAERLSRYIRYETNAFHAVQRLKEGSVKARRVNAEPLFARYLEAVDTLAGAVDRHIRRSSSESGLTSGEKVYG